jgi:hypothetical protein
MAENFPMAPQDSEEPLPLPPIPPPSMLSRVGAPVVASGNVVPRPTTLQNTPMAPYQPVEYQRQAAPAAADPDETQRQRLADFFFGMANSQSPSFFGAIGQAGQALSAGDRQRATEVRESRRAQAEENYRAAQIAVDNAKIALERDPNSPANLARAAQARAQEVTARAALARASQADREPQGQTALVETPAGPAVLNLQNNTLRPLPEGVITPQMQQRRDALEQQRRTAAENLYRQSLALNPTASMTMTPDQIAANAAAFGERAVLEFRRSLSQGRNPSEQAPGATSSAAAPTGTTYDITGRPINR